jgi:ribosomal protein S18 acetylase RimI-like enzyme
MKIKWIFDQKDINWYELSELYRIAPLGEKSPDDLRLSFGNSMFKCFVYSDGKLVGVGRALADGVDCSYICDVAVHPDFQRVGIGKSIVSKLKDFSSSHKKIILYANPGKEMFYKSLGFAPMKTALAVFKNSEWAKSVGLID